MSCRQKRRKADKFKLQIAKIEIEAAKEQAKIEADKKTQQDKGLGRPNQR